MCAWSGCIDRPSRRKPSGSHNTTPHPPRPHPSHEGTMTTSPAPRVRLARAIIAGRSIYAWRAAHTISASSGTVQRQGLSLAMRLRRHRQSRTMPYVVISNILSCLEQSELVRLAVVNGDWYEICIRLLWGRTLVFPSINGLLPALPSWSRKETHSERNNLFNLNATVIGCLGKFFQALHDQASDGRRYMRTVYIRWPGAFDHLACRALENGLNRTLYRLDIDLAVWDSIPSLCDIPVRPSARLRHFELQWSCPVSYPYVSSEELEYVLSLLMENTCLESLSLIGVHRDPTHWPRHFPATLEAIPRGTRSSAVKQIAFYGQMPDQFVTATIFSHVKTLESLIIPLCDLSVPHRLRESVLRQTIGFLDEFEWGRHAATLKSLVVTSTWQRWFISNATTPLPSLRMGKLTRLEELRCPLALVYCYSPPGVRGQSRYGLDPLSPELLPPNLQSLRVDFRSSTGKHGGGDNIEPGSGIPPHLDELVLMSRWQARLLSEIENGRLAQLNRLDWHTVRDDTWSVKHEPLDGLLYKVAKHGVKIRHWIDKERMDGRGLSTLTSTFFREFTHPEMSERDNSLISNDATDSMCKKRTETGQRSQQLMPMLELLQAIE